MSIRIIDGWTRELNLPQDWLDKAKAGEIEIWNAARPFPCHKLERGEFIRGVFYGMIDPGDEFADGYRKRAVDLDASQLVFVTQQDVNAWGQEYCKELGVEFNDFEFDVIARSYLQHSDKE